MSYIKLIISLDIDHNIEFENNTAKEAEKKS